MALGKYKFVETFINPDTGAPYENLDSPKLCYTKHFGSFEGHQIAKIEWTKKIVKRKTTVVDKTGKTVEGEEKEFVEYEERMGEKGGWIESLGNLAQSGKCWLKPSGFILGKAFVSGDAEIAGEVGGSARVYDEAKVKAGCGVGGRAAVFGKAEINSQHNGGAVVGNAKVGGEAKVGGNALIHESARAMGRADVSGQAVVGGSAQILGGGKVSGNTSVKGSAVVYGEVSGNASVMGMPIIMEGGIVKGKALVSGATIVKGEVEGYSTVTRGQPFVGVNGQIKGTAAVAANAHVDSLVEDGFVDDNSLIIQSGEVGKNTRMTDNATVWMDSTLDSQSSMSGNGWVQGLVENGTVGDNAMVGSNGSVNKGSVTGNGKVCSQSSQSEVGGGVSLGKLSKAKVTDGVLVEMSGSIENGSAEGSSVIVGKVSRGKATGGSIVAKGGNLSQGTIDGNSRVSSSYRGNAKDNGDAVGSSQYGVSNNGILLADGLGASGNQVFKEKNDTQPGEAAVICKVEKE